MDKFVNIGLDMKQAELRFVCRLNNKLDMGLKINPKHLMYNPSDTPEPLGATIVICPHSLFYISILKHSPSLILFEASLRSFLFSVLVLLICYNSSHHQIFFLS
jgi:hypothetical protein